MEAWLIPVLFIALRMIRRPKVARRGETPYTKSRALFSPAERALYAALEQAVGEDYRIFAKVRAADIVSVRATANRSARTRAFNQINAKHFDFVLCDKEHLSIRCAVELNDKSHGSHQRQEGDTFSEAVCRAIALPFVKIQAAADYSAVELRKKILAVLSAHPDAEAADSEQPFSVGLVTDSRVDDRPWTIDESGTLGGKPGAMSDSENLKASSTFTLYVDR